MSARRRTNSTGACDLLETLIAASERGLSERLIVEVFRAGARTSFSRSHVGGLSASRVCSYLRRLAVEGRLVCRDTDDGDRRWATPQQAENIDKEEAA